MVFSCLLSGSFSFKSQQVQVAPHASLRMFDLDEQNLAQSFRLLLQNPATLIPKVSLDQNATWSTVVEPNQSVKTKIMWDARVKLKIKYRQVGQQ